AALTRTNVQPPVTGDYLVVITNGFGSATSAVAVLSLFVPRPHLTIPSPGLIQWQGLSNWIYAVQANTNLNSTNWVNVGTASSPTADIAFTNPPGGDTQKFYRVISP